MCMTEIQRERDKERDRGRDYAKQKEGGGQSGEKEKTVNGSFGRENNINKEKEPQRA